MSLKSSTSVQVAPQGSEVQVLAFKGELDLATAPALCARLDAARGLPGSRLLLDLRELGFCDSAGLRALLGAAREVGFSTGRLAVVAPDDGPAAELFAMTGAAELLPLHATVQEGLAALAG